MHVIDKKENRPSPIKRPGPSRRWLWSRGSSRRSQLRVFTRSSGAHQIERTDWLRIAIDPQLEIFAFETIDETPLLIKDHHIGLHQVGVDLHDIVFRGLWVLRSLRTRQRSIQMKQ